MKYSAAKYLMDGMLEAGVISMEDIELVKKLISQAEELEEMRRLDAVFNAYNAGYEDSACNHINDADNYVNELRYTSQDK
jgi:hypothetical protein